jgi:hypothetical protein
MMTLSGIARPPGFQKEMGLLCCYLYLIPMGRNKFHQASLDFLKASAFSSLILYNEEIRSRCRRPSGCPPGLIFKQAVFFPRKQFAVTKLVPSLLFSA